MLLRRVINHFRKQEWTAIAIDFVIVVLGVFVGLQVSNWNADRASRSHEAGILAGIREDLANDEWQLAEGISSADQNTQAANYALHAAGRQVAGGVNFVAMSPDEAGADYAAPDWQDFNSDLSSRLWSLSVVRFHPTQSSSALDALKASGNLRLIRDEGLIVELQEYEQRWGDIVVSQNMTLRPFRDRTIFVGQAFGLSAFSEMPEAEFIALVRDNRELEAALRTMAEYSLIHREMLSETLNLNRALQDRLEAPAP